MSSKIAIGTIYLSHISSYNNPKNKYQEAVLELVATADRMIVEDLEKFRKDLEKRIVELHVRFPKCGKINFHRWKYNSFDSKNYAYSIGDFITVQMLEMRGRFHDQAHAQPFIKFEEKEVSNG